LWMKLPRSNLRIWFIPKNTVNKHSLKFSYSKWYKESNMIQKKRKNQTQSYLN
jgi:hypothetical protein